MTMPMRRVLVRHGQSEANVVQKELIADLDPEVIAEIYSRPDWMQRLSPLGVEQAKNAGEWIRREIGALASFDVIYASPFLRTFETACYAAGDEAVEFTPEDRIIERDWGLYGKVSKTDQELFYPNTYHNKKIDPLYARLDNGESIMDVFLRWRDMAGTMHREYPDGQVLMFTHGDYMMTDRYGSERLLPEEFVALMKDSDEDMLNCSVIDRTRQNPFDEDDVRTKPTWMRVVHTVCPELSPNGGDWVELKSRRTYTVQEALGRVAATPSLLPEGVLESLRDADRARIEEKAQRMGITLVD